MDKRTFIKSVVLGVTGVFTLGFSSSLKAAKSVKKWDGIFKLPELPYSLNDFGPFISADNMYRHYHEYHGAVTADLNKLVNARGIKGISAFQILSDSSAYPEDVCAKAGAYLNHKIFWQILTSHKGTMPTGGLKSAMARDFGSFENFRSQFKQVSSDFSGQGWVWLIADKNGKLQITATANNDNPIMNTAKTKGYPLLGLDLWEHAYNGSRDAYIDSFQDFVNWNTVSKRFAFNNKRKV